MKRAHIISLSLLFSLTFLGVAQEKEPIDYVDVFLGTSNSRWMLGPYTGRPYGIMRSTLAYIGFMCQPGLAHKWDLIFVCIKWY
jgi:hypothetical protein